MRNFYLYNTLSKERELFKSITPGVVGLYVCGPTLYGDPHLGHARPAITYDILVRLLREIGYRVRYVRNITDVGHLEEELGNGEDKVLKQAKVMQLEPMEVVQHYTLRYHHAMQQLNTLPPSIEPRASGHITEQISLVNSILKQGYAYESNGSVYFDVEEYQKKHNYGRLSGRTPDNMLSNTRALEGQEDKRSPFDFALWKKAAPEHIMRWPSPWSEGFPGWHLECSAMSAKYLGDRFDIHGGGIDLLFPHHECELAQNTASRGDGGVNYWMHNNMITINGQKMGKSLGNFITLEELFSGKHPLLESSYSPMAVRLFILQAHYRGTLDFSNNALAAAQKGYRRLIRGAKEYKSLKFVEGKGSKELALLAEESFTALCDDLNTPIAVAKLFDALKVINLAKEGKLQLTFEDRENLDTLFNLILTEILGVVEEESSVGDDKLVGSLVDIVLKIRDEAKAQKNFEVSDLLRADLTKAGIEIKDTKEGTQWRVVENE
ncbi:MAG: cysteine--tRNA ligase [Bacteroidales bacterium]